MKQEKFLFSIVEQACLERLNAMSCESSQFKTYSITYIITCIDPARYLLIRLCLCKRGKWHTLSSLEERYKSEIGGKQHISEAIDELCGIISESFTPNKEETNVIDLTLDDDDDHRETTPRASQYASDTVEQIGENIVDSTSTMDLSEDKLTIFATDDATASVPELLACLPNDDLKAIGKQLKVTINGQNV